MGKDAQEKCIQICRRKTWRGDTTGKTKA